MSKVFKNCPVCEKTLPLSVEPVCPKCKQELTGRKCSGNTTVIMEAKQMKWYNYKFDKLGVTMHLNKDMKFIWKRIVGVQIGSVFIGLIKGDPAND